MSGSRATTRRHPLVVAAGCGAYLAAAVVAASLGPLGRHRPRPVRTTVSFGREVAGDAAERFAWFSVPERRSNTDLVVMAALAALSGYRGRRPHPPR